MTTLIAQKAQINPNTSNPRPYHNPQNQLRTSRWRSNKSWLWSWSWEKTTNRQPESSKLQNLNLKKNPNDNPSLLLKGQTVSGSPQKSKISLESPKNLQLSKQIAQFLTMRKSNKKMLCSGQEKGKPPLKPKLNHPSSACPKTKPMPWCPEARLTKTCFSRKNPSSLKKPSCQPKPNKSPSKSNKRNPTEPVSSSTKTQTKNKISHSKRKPPKRLNKKSLNNKHPRKNLNKKNQTPWDWHKSHKWKKNQLNNPRKRTSINCLEVIRIKKVIFLPKRSHQKNKLKLPLNPQNLKPQKSSKNLLKRFHKNLPIL